MEVRDQLNRCNERGLKVFTTSSFHTQGVVLLHLLSKIDIPLPFYFLNTGLYERLELIDELTHFKNKFSFNTTESHILN